ncbi:hypothetical protein Tco_0960863, partial [Tanacetum coccineum]
SKVIVRVIDDTGSTSLLLFDDMVFMLSGEQYEHITNNNHVYQVKMMSEDEAMITLFTKDFIIEDVVDDMQTPLLSNTKSSKFNTVDTISFNIDETPKLVDGSSKGNGSNGCGEGISKAIKSD